MDGYVVIGTKLDTKQLETDIKSAKKQLTGFQKEEERLLKQKSKVELDLGAYEEQKAKIRANTDEILKQASTDKQAENILQMENIELDKLTHKYAKQFNSLNGINQKLERNKVNQGLMNRKVADLNNKLRKSKSLSDISKNINKVNSGLTNTIKKVGRWALAVFSVRSAYNLIRQASGTLAQYDKQYATNLEYIRYVLAQAIAPVLQFLVNLAFKLLSYINYIANAWFGVNLFSKASAKNFGKMARKCRENQKIIATSWI